MKQKLLTNISKIISNLRIFIIYMAPNKNYDSL